SRGIGGAVQNAFGTTPRSEWEIAWQCNDAAARRIAARSSNACLLLGRAHVICTDLFAAPFYSEPQQFRGSREIELRRWGLTLRDASSVLRLRWSRGHRFAAVRSRPNFHLAING